MLFLSRTNVRLGRVFVNLILELIVYFRYLGHDELTNKDNSNFFSRLKRD
jgi:hypothetical protein